MVREAFRLAGRQTAGWVRSPPRPRPSFTPNAFRVRRSGWWVSSASSRLLKGREAETDKFPKTRKELNDLLDERLAGWECQGRSMFGGRSYFVNGKMFSGSHGDTIAIRLSEPDRTEFLEEIPRPRYSNRFRGEQ